MNIDSQTEISFEALLNPSDPEETGADVILWMGPKKEPIYAHSIILRNASDFYRAAFSSRWNKSTKIATKTSGKDHLDLSSDAVIVANLWSRMFEIYHPEYDKKHMIQVLKYIYRVSTTVDIEDVLDIALLADHLLLFGLKSRCLSYISESANNIEKCAFKLYSLAATAVLSEYKRQLMRLALEVIYQSFDSCIAAIPDLASLATREIEALIVGLPFSAKQKWILLIFWAMASTGMIDKTCKNPMKYVFKDLAWKKKLNKSFKQAVRVLVHVIPFSELSRSDYEEYVMPFGALGLLNVNLRDILAWSFGIEQKVQDPQLLASVKLRDPLQGMFTLPPSFSSDLSNSMRDYIHKNVFAIHGKLFTRVLLQGGLNADTVFKNGVDCRKNNRLKNSPYGASISLHVFTTKQGSLAVVIVDTDQKIDTLDKKTNYMIYGRQGIERTETQNHESDRTNCRYYHDPYSSYQYEAYTKCECRECPTYVEMKANKGQVRYPSALANEEMQDYVIYYID